MLEEERRKIIKQIEELQKRLEVIKGYLEYSDYDLIFYAA